LPAAGPELIGEVRQLPPQIASAAANHL